MATSFADALKKRGLGVFVEKAPSKRTGKTKQSPFERHNEKFGESLAYEIQILEVYPDQYPVAPSSSDQNKYDGYVKLKKDIDAERAKIAKKIGGKSAKYNPKVGVKIRRTDSETGNRLDKPETYFDFEPRVGSINLLGRDPKMVDGKQVVKKDPKTGKETKQWLNHRVPLGQTKTEAIETMKNLQEAWKAGEFEDSIRKAADQLTAQSNSD